MNQSIHKEWTAADLRRHIAQLQTTGEGRDLDAYDVSAQAQIDRLRSLLDDLIWLARDIDRKEGKV
jgi:hypothetical protein